MVTGNLAHKLQPEEIERIDPLAPDPLKYTSVALSEVYSNNTRLEASAFNLEAKAAKYKVEHCKYGFVHLWGENGLVKDAFVRSRFKRIYVEKGEGIPFFQPSSITEIYPKPTKYISENTDVDIDGLKVKKGMLLMSVSGTIGKCSIVGKTLDNKVFSHDLLRLFGKNEYDVGYIYAYFCTPIGQQMLQTNNYGAVVQHIEPEHLKNIIIPNAPDPIKRKIHNLVVESYDLRDESNELIDEAEQILYEELQLPPIEQLKPTYFDKDVDLRNYITKLSGLNLRLDCSYHAPVIKEIIDILKHNSKKIVLLGVLSSAIVLPGRFSRTYVNKENGVPFLGGRDIFCLDPITDKYLSRTIHKKQIESELKIKNNNILTPSRGTIGAVALAPKHFEGKAISDNIINIRQNDDIAGYSYCFLNSDYGRELIRRHIYGGVIDAMEPSMLYNVEIPIIKNESKQKEINDKILQANELRYQAYQKEQEAVSTTEKILESSIN